MRCKGCTFLHYIDMWYHSSKTGKSRIVAQEDSLSHENPLLTGSHLLTPCGLREKAHLWSLLHQSTNHIQVGSGLMRDHLPKAPPQGTMMSGLGSATCKWGEHTHSLYSTQSSMNRSTYLILRLEDIDVKEAEVKLLEMNCTENQGSFKLTVLIALNYLNNW